ncbi:hypothetical protein CBS101457_004035 [Exobasidium rhododendri]|nr:hypothetical protein CBS101457_004035 [Exobasidium rhododendri]
MAYPGRQGQHYQQQQQQQQSYGGGAPQMPMADLNYGQQQHHQQQQQPMYNNHGPPQNQYGGNPSGGYGQPPLSYGQQGQMGNSAYQGQTINYQQPQGMQQAGNQRFQYSNMQGKRKALLIGCNYIGTRSELRGCINDVHNVQQFLRQRAGYKDDDMVVLTDDARDPRSIPTRQNMTAAMHWLVSGASPGDALFFHYSGHGGQAKATQGDEDDGMNETILPVDFQVAGQMEDDELHMIMVRPLPVGCRLTALFDSCHSGTALDLPYVYSTSGKIKEPNIAMGFGKGIAGAAMDYARGDVMGMAKDLFSTFKTATSNNGAEKITRETRSSGADVVMLSGCKDSQTSADATEAGRATGAMSWAFIKVMTELNQLSYQALLCSTRDLLAQKYSQKPQLSCSHPIDMELLFVI